MYSPYLYGRQSELLSLRNLLTEGGDLSRLIPIVEPVVTKTSGVIRCVNEFAKSGQPLIIVSNPEKHDFKNDPRGDRLKEFTKQSVSLFLSGKATPAYKIGPSTRSKDVDAFLKSYKDVKCCIIYESPSLNDSYIEGLAKNGNISYHVVLNERIPDSQHSLLPTGKLIATRDYFNKQARNADYGKPEFFTSLHKKAGKDFLAFGDFTIVGSTLEVGGGKPAAVAIHLTHRRKGGSEIWVEHFVSDDTDRDSGSAESKFLEAVDKAVTAFTSRRPEFGADFALSEYERHQRQRTFPQLGKNKELQIHHHMRLMLEAV